MKNSNLKKIIQTKALPNVDVKDKTRAHSYLVSFILLAACVELRLL